MNRNQFIKSIFNRSFSFRLSGIILSAFIFASATDAQTTTADLSGIVADETGAVVPNVTLRAINAATNLERSVVTNDDGAFTIPLLPPGSYTLRAERAGFAPVEINDVVLNVNDRRTIRINLKVGAVGATVTVENQSPLVDESPAVSTVVDRQFVENIPLNGRSFQSLITLTPGVVLTKTNFAELGQFSVNGQRADANYFTVDGVSANFAAGFGQAGGGAIPATTALGGTNNLVSVDALQEFRIQTSTYAPEFGRTVGAQVQLVTRSGTNDFRGTLFEYLRNDVFDANDFFANRNGLERPPLRQNQFGGVIGGPVFLPHFGEGGRSYISGRDRSFFFFSYEGLRLRQPQVGITGVPTLSARRRASIQIQPLLNAFPLPNGADLGSDLAQFSASYSNPSTLDAVSLRIDHAVNDRLSFFGRFNNAPSESVRRGGEGSLSTVVSSESNTRTFTLGSTQVLTPSITNEVRANYSRNQNTVFNGLDNFGGAIVPSSAQLLAPFAAPEGSTVGFSLNSSVGATFITGPERDNFGRQFNLVNNLSVVAKSHALKFGIDYRYLSPINGPGPLRVQPSFAGVAGALSGMASSLSVSSSDTLALSFHNFSAYAQDTWKLNRRLTLNYGLRYEVNPPPKGKNGKELYPVVGLDNPATFALGQGGTPLFKTTYNNFAPRAGFAYQLFQTAGRETVLRGGFGLYYDLGSGAIASIGGGFPYSRTRFSGATPFPLIPANALPPAFNLNPPFTALVRAVDPNLKLPRVYQFNVAVEQSLGTSQTITATYVGAVGKRLLRQESLFQPNANFSSSVFVTRNAATSDYHALQLQFQRRLSRGFQALASYTFAKSLDIASSDAGFALRGDRIDPQTDRGPSDFDVRHAFNAGVTYKIPLSSNNSFLDAVIRNFAVDAIYTARTATPVTPTATRNIGFGFVSVRPDLVPGIPLYLDDPNAPGGRRINNTPVAGNPNQRGAFLIPTEARQGTLGRNNLRGFPLSQLDFALRRQFNLSERLNLQLRAEFFNIFNHPNFADPNTNLGFVNPATGVLGASPLFGQSTATFGRGLANTQGGGSGNGFNALYQIGGPRSAQFALRLQF